MKPQKVIFNNAVWKLTDYFKDFVSFMCDIFVWRAMPCELRVVTLKVVDFGS